MPNTNSRKSKRPSARRRNSRRSTTPASFVQRYNGPYKLPGSSEQNTLYTMEMKSVLALSSSVAGVINLVVDNNPTGYQDWSSVAALWDEYRPLSLLIEFKPNNRYSKTTTVTTPIYVLIDRDSLGALSSKNAAIQYESTKIRSLDDPYRQGVKTIGTTGLSSAMWITTASPTATYCIKHYAESLSNSTTYGDVIVTLLIELRGRN